MYLPQEVQESMLTICNMAIDDERKHWEESGKPNDHIYHEIMTVLAWLSEEDKQRSHQSLRASQDKNGNG